MESEKTSDNNSLDKPTEELPSIISTITNATINTFSAIGKITTENVENIKNSINEKNQEEIRERNQEVEKALEKLSGTTAEKLLNALGDSPIELNKKRISQIKDTFPIPREQCVLWADAEFDLRPSGIVITNVGVFIKSNIDVFNNKTESGDEKKSELFYYRWDSFEPEFFTDKNDTNKALLVDSKCYPTFINACKELCDSSEENDPFYYYESPNKKTMSNCTPLSRLLQLLPE